MPLAPCRLISSSSGQRIAPSAAIKARPSPVPSPVPIIAIPISAIMVRTSAKSTLIRPSNKIKSVIPCTAPNKTSFACLKALITVISLPSTCNSFSLGTIINESTRSFNCAIPSSAIAIRFLPSNEKGRVTTPTVKIPICLATSAITGAPPVPVPPPIPAVINTMSAPSRA